MRSQNSFAVAVVSLLLVFRSPLLAADPPPAGSLPAELETAARQILKVMAAMNQTQLQVGQIVPIGNRPANSGPGIQLELTEALERMQKGVISPQATMAIMGQFLPVDDPEDQRQPGDPPGSQLVVEKLRLDAVDMGSGDVMKSIVVHIRRLRDIAAIEGITASIDPDADVRGQNKQLRQSLDDLTRRPAVIVDRTKICSHAGSPYSLAIAAKPRDFPSDPSAALAATVDDKGMPHVAIDKGQCYELKFINDSDHEVAISTRIDGIDVFQFSEERDELGQPASTRFVVAAHGQVTIPGWYKTGDASRSDNFQRFLVTEYGQGASSLLPRQAQGQIGMITVAVSNCHVPGSGRARGGAETGFGPPVKADVRPVRRTVDPPHDFIAVRYLR